MAERTAIECKCEVGGPNVHLDQHHGTTFQFVCTLVQLVFVKEDGLQPGSGSHTGNCVIMFSYLSNYYFNPRLAQTLQPLQIRSQHTGKKKQDNFSAGSSSLQATSET